MLFCKTFTFRTIRLESFHHTDNSAGISCHFVARMNSGSGIIRALSGEELHLRAGDIFYLPKGLQYHSYWTIDETGDRSVSWESYGFTYYPYQMKHGTLCKKYIPLRRLFNGWTIWNGIRQFLLLRWDICIFFYPRYSLVSALPNPTQRRLCFKWLLTTSNNTKILPYRSWHARVV